VDRCGNHEVAIPYAEWLASQIPPVAVRLRRDFRALLRLIQAHAILHQLSRETDAAGRIVATEADYLAVRELVADLISDALGSTVRPATRETVEAVAKLDQGHGVKVHDLAVHLDLERSTVQYRVTAARERGYLVNLEKRGKPARYQADAPMPGEAVILPERIGGVKPHPAPAHHIPGDAEPQASDGTDGWCEGVNEPQRGHPQAAPCMVCSDPLDPALAAAGYATHPMCDPDETP
jgi:DNA-binding transcriptional ArsR family regulator